MAGLLEGRADTGLLVADLLEVLLQLVHRLLVGQQLLHRQSCLVHLVDDLWNAQVVVLTHEEGDELVQSVVFLLDVGVVLHHVGNHDGCIHLLFVIHAEGHTLKPHHTLEILLEHMVAGVVTTWTEEAVGKRQILEIGDESAGAVSVIPDMCYLFSHELVIARIGRHACEEMVGHVEEADVTGSCVLDDLLTALIVDGPHLLHHLVAVVVHQGIELVGLQLAQHTVDIEVVELQVEVGGDEAGEVVVVVLLVHLEELVVAGRHDAEAVLCQLLAQLWVELLQLRGIGQVGHVHAQTFVNSEVLFDKLLLALLQATDKRLFLIIELQGTRLLDQTVVVVVDVLVLLAGELAVGQVLVEGIHQRVVPRGGQEDVTDVGVLEGKASLGSRGVAQRTDIGQGES